MSDDLRVCLIGCGRMGATIDDEVPTDIPYSHAAGHCAAEGVELVAVCDALADKVKAIQERYDVPRGYTDYREMIEQEQPDIVSVATRPGPHAEIVEFLAESKVKGIYCEKPLCCSMEEADRILAACEAHNVKFNYGTNRRYQPMYQKMRALIESGMIGELKTVIAYCGPGGVQWSHTHMADMLMLLAGDPDVKSVQAAVGAADTDWVGNRLPRDPGLHMGFVRFANGVLGYHTASAGYEFEANGSKGSLRALDNGGSLQFRPMNGDIEIIEGIRFSRGTVECVEDLRDAIRTDGPTLGGVQLACRSQEIILGFVASGREQGASVSLPLADREMYVGPTDW